MIYWNKGPRSFHLPFTAEILVAYLICFALVHSLLSSLGFKTLARGRLGTGIDRWYTKAFGMIALITIVPLALMLITSPGRLLYLAPLPVMLAMFCAQAVSAVGSVRAFTDAPHRFSIKAQLDQESRQPLAIRGIYCWVRDPFLLSGLTTIWLTPFMTSNLLLIYALISLYLFLGSLHWERRLQAQFGDEYRAYRSQVPRCIPYKGRCYPDR